MRYLVGTSIFPYELESKVAFTIDPPSAADQIPVSTVDSVTGAYKYIPVLNPLNAIFSDPTNTGKALVVNPQGNGLVAKDIPTSTALTDALVHVTGVIGDPSISIVSGNVIRISPYKAAFYSAGAGETFIDMPQADITITKANTNNPADDITYLLLDPTGTYVQTSVRPSESLRRSSIYLAEISHINGGPITNVRLYYNPISEILLRQQQLADRIGLQAKGFKFTWAAATGQLSQTGTLAQLLGFYINPTGAEKNIVSFPAAAITAEYFSYDAALKVASFTDFRKTYKIDNPLTGTSTTFSGQHRGILVVMASINGKYLVIAPQKEYTTFDEANQSRLIYLAELVLPDGFTELYTPVATIVVEATVNQNSQENQFSVAPIAEFGYNGGSHTQQQALPAPTAGTAGDILVVNPSATGYELAHDPVPSFATAPAGQFVVTSGTGLTTQAITVNQINAGLVATMLGVTGYKLAIFDIDANGVVSNTSGDFTLLDDVVNFGSPIVTTRSITYNYKSNLKRYFGHGLVLDKKLDRLDIMFPTSSGYYFKRLDATSTFKIIFPFIDNIFIN